MKINTKVMTKVQVFKFITWLNTQHVDGVIDSDYAKLADRATKELGFPCTIHTVMSSMQEMCLVTKKKIRKESSAETEILRRLRMLEKFVTKYFPDDWAELWKEE